MDIPRTDMLPDVSQTNDLVVSEDTKTQKPVVSVKDEQTQKAVQEKAVKTPQNELLAALHEERKARKNLEQKLKELESSQSSSLELADQDYSDEGRSLKKEISSLKEELSSLKEQQEFEKIVSQYPVLKDKLEEFETFRNDYPKHKLINVAKIFLAENDLLESVPKRKGLESPTSGSKADLITSDFSAEDIDRLMKTQPRKFIELVRRGAIDPDKIR